MQSSKTWISGPSLFTPILERRGHELQGFIWLYHSWIRATFTVRQNKWHYCSGKENLTVSRRVFHDCVRFGHAVCEFIVVFPQAVEVLVQIFNLGQDSFRCVVGLSGLLFDSLQLSRRVCWYKRAWERKQRKDMGCGIRARQREAVAGWPQGHIYTG